MIKSFNYKETFDIFEIQYDGSEVENIRYRDTSDQNITNQRINLTKLKKYNENYITLQYTTLTLCHIHYTKLHWSHSKARNFIDG